MPACCVSSHRILLQLEPEPLYPPRVHASCRQAPLAPLSSLCPSTPPCPLAACPRWNSTLSPPSSKLAAPTRRLTAALSTHPPCHRLPFGQPAEHSSAPRRPQPAATAPLRQPLLGVSPSQAS